MKNNTGKEIKICALIIFALCMLAIIGVTVFLFVTVQFYTGIIVFVAGTLSCLVCVSLMYGFGQLIMDISIIAKAVTKSQESPVTANQTAEEQDIEDNQKMMAKQ